MSDDKKPKFVTVGEALAMFERMVAAFEEEASTLEVELVESFAGKVPDEALKLIRVQVRENKTVALLKLKRSLSPEGLRLLLKTHNRKARTDQDTADAVSSGNPSKWMVKSLREVAEFFQVDRQTLNGWRDSAEEPMPGTTGAYPVDLIIQWAMRHNWFQD